MTIEVVNLIDRQLLDYSAKHHLFSAPLSRLGRGSVFLSPRLIGLGAPKNFEFIAEGSDLKGITIFWDYVARNGERLRVTNE